MSAGFEYEKQIIANLREAGVNGNIQEAAGASSFGIDADFRINDEIYGLEIKMNNGAQMGGSSIRYDKETGNIELLENLDRETTSLIRSAAATKTEELDRLIDFISGEWSKDVRGFPLSCSKEVWSKAAEAGLLVNTKIEHTADVIAEHYSRKGVDYIQIGNAGLFYLKDNPANLPIPKLEGKACIEIRSGRSGSKKRKDGTKMVGAGIRAQARLHSKKTSCFTLENADDIDFLKAFFMKKAG